MPSDLRRFKAAIELVLQTAVDGSAVAGICAACADVLPADGVAVTVMVSDAKRETVFASDDVISTFEDVQYALGEGPSLDVFTSRRPVLIADLQSTDVMGRWPGLIGETAALGLGSVFCFPLQLGTVSVGICTFYRGRAGSLTEGEVDFVFAALDLTTLALLEVGEVRSGASVLEQSTDLNGSGRLRIHQATGMLMSQLAVPAEEAFARLRGEAYVRGTSLDRLAAGIISSDIHLQPDPGGS